MRRRVMSACLALVLFVSSADINALAMPAGTVSNGEIAFDSSVREDNISADPTSGDNASQDKTSGDNTSQDKTFGDNTSQDQTSEDNTLQDNTSGDESSEDDSVKDDIPEENNLKNDDDIEAETDTETQTETDTDTDTEAQIETDTDIDTDLPDAVLPVDSTTQSFLTDTEAPYYGDYLLVANVNTDDSAAAQSSGVLPEASASMYDMGGSGDYIYPVDNPNIYDFDENGLGIIEPDLYLPEIVNDEYGMEYQANQEAAETEYYVGEEKSFYLNTTAQEEYNSVDCVCAAVSEYCTVWVPLDDPIYVADAEKMKDYMNTFALEFDSQFPKMTEMFGSKEVVDKLYGDNDGKTALLCYDINGNKDSGSSYKAGYFFAADLNINYPNRTHNDIDCLHIDSWQGMSRKPETNTLDPLFGKRTMVHELQHMINYSICRNNEPSDKFTKLQIPTYLNEGYSEAAAHLCYGMADNRISYYKEHSYIAEGKVSLFKWGGYDTLSNYALSYLFSQYIRTQYVNDDTIYKDTMNALTMSNDLFSVIADKLGVTGEELLLNFRAALFLKDAEGAYGFSGEEWAESIQSQYTGKLSGTSVNLASGAAVVVPMSEGFEPDGAGSSIRFVGMYKDLTEDDIEVQVEDSASITEDKGELQLSASVFPGSISQSVIFSLPNPEEGAYAQVTASGLVSAIANGTVTVRATSVYKPDKYADITVTITGQLKTMEMEPLPNPVYGGIEFKCNVTGPSEAVVYYTTDEEAPTTDSDIIPEEGLFFDTAGVYKLKLLGHDPAGVYRDCYQETEIVVEQLPEPVISNETFELDGINAQRITIQMQDGAIAYYTTDSSLPSLENGIRYEEPFIIDKLGTTTVNVIALKEGAASSSVVSAEIIVQRPYETMNESVRKPYMTQMSFTLNKKSEIGTQFSILPIMENTILNAELLDNVNDFALERVKGTNDWHISLVNKTLANKTYPVRVIVTSVDADNVGYADTISVKVKVTDIKPQVSLKAVTINTVYPMAAYPLTVTSKSGKVEIIGISNGNNPGFTDNFEVKEGVLYLKRAYEEFVKTPNNKPVLSGKLDVQVEGYEPQNLNFNVKTINKAPALIPSDSSIRLNYNRLNESEAKSFVFTLDKKLSAKEKHSLEDIENVKLDENGGAAYNKAEGFVQDISCSDGRNIIVKLKNIKSGTYTIPLLVSTGTGEDSFSNVKCSVKFVIEKENVNPILKLSTGRITLNRKASGAKAYIAVKSTAQSNMELTDIQCEYAEMTKSVNTDQNVTLSYNSVTKMLEAKITGEPSCNTYKFRCTPVYNGESAQDKAVTVTVSVVDKQPSVTLKAKGSIDVLNRDTSAVTYTIKKFNFTCEPVSVEFEKASKLTESVLVEFEKASKLTESVLDAEEFFDEPVLDKENSTLSISAKKDAVLTKGKKYAFRLKFMLEGCDTPVVTKDITIRPKQPSVKLKATDKPVFYTYVNTGNNTKAVTLQSNKGRIERVEWNEDANKKIPKGITPIIEDGQLKGVTFDGDGSIKKGTYKLAFNVYYEGQMWEKPTSRKASYAKPKVFKLTVRVK